MILDDELLDRVRRHAGAFLGGLLYLALWDVVAWKERQTLKKLSTLEGFPSA